jgi:hypothetical protein
MGRGVPSADRRIISHRDANMPFPRRQRKPRRMPMHGALTNQKIAPSNVLSRRRSMTLMGLTRNGTIGFSAARGCGSKPYRADSAEWVLRHPASHTAMRLQRCACSRICLGSRADIGVCRSTITPTQRDAKGGLQCRDSGFGVHTPVVAINSNGSRALRRRA